MKERDNVVYATFCRWSPGAPPPASDVAEADKYWFPSESPEMDEAAPLSNDDLDHLRAAITEGR